MTCLDISMYLKSYLNTLLSSSDGAIHDHTSFRRLGMFPNISFICQAMRLENTGK